MLYYATSLKRTQAETSFHCICLHDYCTSEMRPVFSPKDLDGIECRMANPMETAMINMCAGATGLARIQRTTYRNACRQGWAPQPTNEFQQAIWDEVRQLPSKPIKIEFDPKKGK